MSNSVSHPTENHWHGPDWTLTFDGFIYHLTAPAGDRTLSPTHDSPLIVRDKSTALSIAAQDMNTELVTFFVRSGRLSPEVIFHTLHNSPRQMREYIRTIQGY